MTTPAIDPQFTAYLRDPPRLSYTDPEDPWLVRTLIHGFEACLGRRKLERVYHGLKADNCAVQDFFTAALQAARIQVSFDAQRLAAIPQSGPLVFVANHPFGVIDGLVLCDLALRARGDLRIMLHALLCQDRDFAPYFLPIDFQESRQAVLTNIRAKQLALENLKQDIPVLIFPSGMVSTADRRGFGKVTDGPWTTFAAKIIREAQATVVPFYFHGCNSRPFHVASHLAQPLRTALLLHEAANKFGKSVRVEVGAPLPWEQLQAVGGRSQLTEYLYNQVQALAAPVTPVVEVAAAS
jgi:putative hemolysin